MDQNKPPAPFAPVVLLVTLGVIGLITFGIVKLKAKLPQKAAVASTAPAEATAKTETPAEAKTEAPVEATAKTETAGNDLQALSKVFKEKGMVCSGCHQPSMTTLGPSMEQIAERHIASDETALKELYQKVIKGYQGKATYQGLATGAMAVMPPNAISEEDVAQLITYMIEEAKKANPELSKKAVEATKEEAAAIIEATKKDATAAVEVIEVKTEASKLIEKTEKAVEEVKAPAIDMVSLKKTFETKGMICGACHMPNLTATGPSMKLIAEKHANSDKAALEALYTKIIKGYSGPATYKGLTTGQFAMMPPNPISQEDAALLVKFMIETGKAQK